MSPGTIPITRRLRWFTSGRRCPEITGARFRQFSGNYLQRRECAAAGSVIRHRFPGMVTFRRRFNFESSVSRANTGGRQPPAFSDASIVSPIGTM